MATAKTLCLVGFLLFTSILIQSMKVNAATHACLVGGGAYVHYVAYGTTWSYDVEGSCSGEIVQGRYSPIDDVYGDCIDWCKEFGTEVRCAQMNEDETHKIYCACYQGC